jgi:hypothetical protein
MSRLRTFDAPGALAAMCQQQMLQEDIDHEMLLQEIDQLGAMIRARHQPPRPLTSVVSSARASDMLCPSASSTVSSASIADV